MTRRKPLKPPLIELLRQLINFETNEMKLLQLALFAQEERRTTLARPKLHNFRSRIAMASTLERLSLDELKAMLKFRWEVASGGERHPVTDEAVAVIFRGSEGMPREANILADNSLLLAFVRKERHISHTVVEEAVTDRQLKLSRKESST